MISDDDLDLLRLFHQCDRGLSGMVWPDGGSLLDQPAVLVQAFNVISNELARLRKSGD